MSFGVLGHERAFAYPQSVLLLIVTRIQVFFPRAQHLSYHRYGFKYLQNEVLTAQYSY